MKLQIISTTRENVMFMRNIGVRRLLACFSIFVFVFTMIAPISNIYAYSRGVTKKEYSEYLATYQENLDEFKKLNKKVHSKDLTSKLNQAKEFIFPTLSSLLYLSIVLFNTKENLTPTQTLKHAGIAVAVALISKISEKISSGVINTIISE